MLFIIRNMSVQAEKCWGGGRSWAIRGMWPWRADRWLDSEACWEALGKESDCVTRALTLLNKHHQTAQCETAAATSCSPVWINVMGSVWHGAGGQKVRKHFTSPSTVHYLGKGMLMRPKCFFKLWDLSWSGFSCQSRRLWALRRCPGCWFWSPPAPVDCKPNWWRQMGDTARYLFVPSETFSFACYLFSCTLVRYSNVTAMKHESIKPLSFNSNRNIQKTYLLFLLIAISTCITHRKPRLLHNDNTSTHTGNLILFVCNN